MLKDFVKTFKQAGPLKRDWIDINLKNSLAGSSTKDLIDFLDPCLGAKMVASSSVDYVPESTSAAFNRLRISNSALNGAILKVVDLKLAEHSAVKALVNLN